MRMRLINFFILAALTSGCVSTTIPNIVGCHVAGVLDAGANCAENNTGRTRQIDLNQFLTFLEAQDERPDPDHPGKKLPPRAGAVCISAAHYAKIKTAEDKACRIAGAKCNFDKTEVILDFEK